MDFLLFNTFFFTLLLFCAFVALAQWRQTQDALILWYIGYLLFTFLHYGRQYWIVGAEEYEFMSPPTPPLHWNSPLSYAAFACYFLFIARLMDIQATAPRLSYVLTRLVHVFAWMIGLHLLLQALWGNRTADQVHRVFQVLLFPTMLWLMVHLWRNARLGYQKLVLVGSMALVGGFVCVIATRLLDGRYDLINGAICCFPTHWGCLPLYHFKLGIAIDVACFSWALTLRQRDLLAAAIVLALPSAPIQKVIISPLDALPEDAFLKKVRDFLSRHFHLETLSVEQVAVEAVRLSVSQTNRKIKEKTGLTTAQFVLQYRLDKALGRVFN